jgi:hypothetical protein
MPKNTVTDPITDQEIAFAHLVLSGTMNDRQAAEAAGLNPTTASYTKSKPRVREYMDQHRAAVSEKLIEQETEELRKRSLARDQIRDQILDRLWQLARLSPEVTRGSIAGQVKAMSIIAAIEGVIPDRRISPAHAQPASPPVQAQIYVAEPLRRQREAEGKEPGESVTAVEAQPTTPPVPEPPGNPAGDEPSVTGDHSHAGQDNPFPYPKGVSWAPNAIGPNFDAYTNNTSPLRPTSAPGQRRFGRGR